MEISRLKDPESITTRVTVAFDEDGEPKEGFIVLGTNSTKYQDAVRQWNVNNVRRSAVKGKAPDTKTEEGALAWISTLADREMVIACACTVDLFGFTNGDAPAVADLATLKAIFTKRPAWKAKVVAAVENDALFTEG